MQTRDKYLEALKERKPLPVELAMRTSFKTPIGAVNHFLIGGDPEFMLVQREVLVQHGEPARQINAQSLGLTTGRAFGADQSGRQVELRPWASRHAHKVVASTYTTLRWFSAWLQSSGELRNFSFYGPPYFNGDGLGGHVHFGRRSDKTLQTVEYGALAMVYRALTRLGVFDSGGCELRRSMTSYGKEIDVRKQAYGYEYRSYPTWLASPATAMIVLTLSKLAVIDPELFLTRDGTLSAQDVLALFYLFRQRGDVDSALCVEYIKQNGLPQAVVSFEGNWGLPEKPPQTMPTYFPASIQPSNEDVQAIVDYMNGRALERTRPLIATWAPINIPKKYEQLTPGVGIGINEITCDLVKKRGCSINVTHMSSNGVSLNKGACFHVKKRFGAKWQDVLKRYVPQKIPLIAAGCADGPIQISLGPDARKPVYTKRMKRFLTAIFPFIKVSAIANSPIERESYTRKVRALHDV